MSLKISSLVWEHSKATHGALLVLLKIADFADDDGYAYPAVKTLAKSARLSERAAHNAITHLQSLGELTVSVGTGPRGCNEYRILHPCKNCTPAKTAPLQKLHPRNFCTPAKIAGGGAENDAPPRKNCTQTVIEQSREKLTYCAGEDSGLLEEEEAQETGTAQKPGGRKSREQWEAENETYRRAIEGILKYNPHWREPLEASIPPGCRSVLRYKRSVVLAWKARPDEAPKPPKAQPYAPYYKTHVPSDLMREIYPDKTPAQNKFAATIDKCETSGVSSSRDYRP